MADPVVCQLGTEARAFFSSGHRLPRVDEGVARRLPALTDWPGYPRRATVGVP
jgi:hypothetical protein